MKGKLAAVVPLAGGLAAFKVYDALRKPKALSVHYLDAPTKVLVVGGGFGGITAAKKLVHALDGSREVGVALLDRVNFTTFYPMVPKVVSSNVEIGHLAHSIRSIVTPLGVDFNQTEVEGVDFEAREVLSNKGSFPYDYLVLAPGSRTAFFDAKGVQENAIDLKGLREALQVRNTIIDRLEEAQWSRGDHDDGLLTFVFVGGGPTGVEGAAGAHDLIHNVLKLDYPEVDFDRVRLVLINSGARILKDIDPSLANAAIHRLASQRIEVRNDTKVTEIRPDEPQGGISTATVSNVCCTPGRVGSPRRWWGSSLRRCRERQRLPAPRRRTACRFSCSIKPPSKLVWFPLRSAGAPRSSYAPRRVRA
jgi:hypothetical protein